jgi:hypothetical protein
VKALAVALAIAALVSPARADDPVDPYGAGQAPLPPPAPPAPPVSSDPSTALAQANAAATAGDWEAVARHVAPLLPGDDLGKGDRAEAHRLAGLAAYFLGRIEDAERELLEYLKLDVDARLDPAVVPPEAVTFFEDVRARHGAELRALRPRGKRYFMLNFIPPVGQFQNGHKVKGWILAGGLFAFTAANVTTYFVLRDWCSGDHDLCEADGSSRADRARTLKTINVVSGIGALALYAYGVIDGIRHYRKRSAMLRIEPTSGGGVLMLSGQW